MTSAILLPNLGTGNETIRVSGWLVEPGDRVDAGDRLVEVRVQGMTFDVSAPATGRLSSVEKPLEAVIAAGDVLGWIEADE